MAKIAKDTFKRVVKTVLEERGYTSVTISMSLFGLQGKAQFKQPGLGLFGRTSAQVYFKEKNGLQYLEFEMENGANWLWEIPEGF